MTLSLAMLESPMQMMVVLVIVLLLFGGSKIPEMMKGLGSGMREFKKSMNEEPESNKNTDEKKSDS
ncbi:MAG: twin-arginine translocase TatA/TatE family subunit [Armatimonadetes bacterium]|nr:twin-arginine translocase TatA/TatE family subunit [Armatimonadota bacterium]